MGGVFRLFSIIILVFLLAACGDGLFSSLDDAEETKLEMIASGAVVGPEAEISLGITYHSEDVDPASTMSVIVRTPEGTIVQETEYEATVLSLRNPVQLTLNDLPEGVYFLEIEAWRNGSVLFHEERQLFVTSLTPSIESLSLYPSRLSPDAEAVAVAEIAASTTHRPYVRWSMSGTLVVEGYLADGFDRAVFSGGNDPGAYRIQIEVFPWGPDEGVQPDLGTGVRQLSDLVVRESGGGQDESGDDDQLLLRYDFAGRLVPAFAGISLEGEKSDFDLSALPDGDVVLDVLEGRLGYRIGGNGTVTVPVSAVPSVPEEALQLNLRVVRPFDEPGLILSVETTGVTGFPAFRLFRAEATGTYRLELGNERHSYQVSERNVSTMITVFFVRGTESLHVALQLDDEQTSSIYRAEIPPNDTDDSRERRFSIVETGRIVLGGDAATPMLVTGLEIRRTDPDRVLESEPPITE